MPRVKLNKRAYMLKDLSRYVKNEMAERKLTQKKVAERLGCSQQGFSYKLATHSLNANDLITIFTLFDTTPEEMAKLLKE